MASKETADKAAWTTGVPGHARPDPLTVRIGVAVKLTGISRSKLYELIKADELETVKIGSSTLILFESLRRMIDRRRDAPKAVPCAGTNSTANGGDAARSRRRV